MPQTIALLTGALVMLVAGFKNVSVGDVLRGNLNQRGAVFDFGDKATDSAGIDFGSKLPGKTPSGLKTFDGHLVAGWMVQPLKWARQHGWSGKVISGFRSRQEQAATCATGVKPCATPGKSNHQYADYPYGAVDVTEPDELAQVLTTYPYNPTPVQGLAINDRPHFSSNGH